MACSEPSSGRGLHYFWCVEQQFQATKAYLYPAQSHEGEVLAEVLAIQPTGDIAVDKKKADAIKKLGSRGETRLALDSNLWDEQCAFVMLDAVLSKFTQNQSLFMRLLRTPGQIAEAAWYDDVWALGHCEFDKEDSKGVKTGIVTSDGRWQIPPSQWRGQNKLGKIHTILRDYMQHMLYGTPASNAVVDDLMRSCPPPKVMVEVGMDKVEDEEEEGEESAAFKAIAAVADQLYDCISSGLVGVLEAEGWYSDTQNPSDFTFFVGRERNMLNYHLSNFMKEGHVAILGVRQRSQFEEPAPKITEDVEVSG